jgi:hypothetical protein
MAYARNVAASSVLRFAARACGYPSSLLNIHPLADAGSGFQQIGASALMQPDQQPWSAVVSSLQQNSGTEWFFGARGELYWRQLNFLDPWFPAASFRPKTLASKVRTLSAEDILHADVAQSDQGIVTDVQVRFFGGGGFVQTAANWPSLDPGKESSAHKNMVAHLRTRRLVVYAPWILHKDAALYLAQVLYEQYSAGVAQASITIPADPLIEVGSLVDVPDVGQGGTTRYYVSSITAQLQWGGGWTYTLGLAYGRSPDQGFPYVGTVTFPALTRAATKDAPRPASITPLSITGGTYYDDTPYAIVAQSGLAKNEAAVSTAVYPPGSVIYIYTKPHSAGKLVGPAPLGEYTTVAPSDPEQADTTIALRSTKSTIGYVTVKTVGTPSAPEIEGGFLLGLSASGSRVQEAAAQINLPGITNSVLSGEGTGTGRVLIAPDVAVPAPRAGSLAQRAFAQALHYRDAPGRPHYNNDGVHSTGQVGYFGDGQRSFDCAGLVLWCYAQCGYTWGGQVVPQADGGINYIFPAAGIYRWFADNHGGRTISVDQSQPGDLLFCCNSDDYTGITHIAFCSKAGGFASGEDFAAGNWNQGIGSWTIASEGGAPFRFAIDMSAVTLNS